MYSNLQSSRISLIAAPLIALLSLRLITHAMIYIEKNYCDLIEDLLKKVFKEKSEK